MTSELTTIQKHIEEAKKRKYIMFNPNQVSFTSFNAEFADTLYEVTWKCRDDGYVDEFDTLKKIRNGVYRFGSIEIYDLKKYPKLIESLIGIWENKN